MSFKEFYFYIHRPWLLNNGSLNGSYFNDNNNSISYLDKLSA